MAAVPRFNIPSAAARLPSVDLPRRRPAAILCFQRGPTLTPVDPDPAEGRALAPAVPAVGEILSGWIVALALAMLGFVLF